MKSLSVIFSIIIPTYNRNKELQELINDLNRQTISNFEIIIVDDKPDNIPIDTSSYGNVRYIKNKHNLGPSGSRNAGAKNAIGEWLVFLDDDDRFDINKLNVLKKYIDKECNFIYHPIRWFMVNENCSYQTQPEINVNKISFDKMLYRNQIGGTPGYSIKKDFFFELGGFNEKLRALEDYELLLRLVLHPDFKPTYIDIPLTHSFCYTTRKSVSKNTKNTIDSWIRLNDIYPKTILQKKMFLNNKLNILAYAEIVNLNRKSGVYYMELFFRSFKLTYLIAGIIALASPRMLIKLRCKIS